MAINKDITKTFCVARWGQVSVFLPAAILNGCYLTKVHSLPPTNENGNLYNTIHQKLQRKLMVSGIWPKDCQTCKLAEETLEKTSDRNQRNNSTWGKNFLKSLDKETLLEDVFPTYIEVGMSHRCNMACLYCGPAISSRIEKDILKNGTYPVGSTSYDLHPVKSEQTNPYVENFLETISTNISKVQVLRLTGGEPLLSDKVKELMLILNKEPKVNLLELSVNTNLNYSRQKLSDFLNQMEQLYLTKRCKKLVVFTSIDTWNQHAEYARLGLDLELFKSNLEFILENHPEIQVSLMSTYSILSINKYDELLAYILKLRIQYNTKDKSRITLDIPYLRHPFHLALPIITEEFYPQIESQINFMRDNHSEKNLGFSNQEIELLSRNLDFAKEYNGYESVNEDRADFYRFIMESDRRNSRNFIQTFPEMENFFELCKKLAAKYPVRKDKIAFTNYPWIQKKS